MSQLEASLPRPPFESLSHIVRNSQKIVLKELTTATSAAKQLSATLNPTTSSSQAKASKQQQQQQQPSAQQIAQADKQINALVATVTGLKRRLEEMERMAQRQAKGLTVRLEYLAQMERDEQVAGTGAKKGAAMLVGGSEQKRQEGEKQKAKDMDVEDNDTTATQSTADIPTNTSNGHSSNGHRQHNGTHAAPSPSAFTLTSIHAITPPPTPTNRLHHLFLDYCLRSSLHRTATLLSTTTPPSLAALSDAPLFAGLQAVVGGLRGRDVGRLLVWCGEWRSRLVRMGSSLEWDARCVEMMEMVKRGEREAAMEYGRKWLGVGVTAGREGGAKEEEKDEKETAAESDSKSQWDDTVVQDRLRKLQEAMTAALYYPLFHPTSADSAEAVLFTASSSAYHRYSRYWSDERWADLEQQFRLTHLAVHGLPQHSQLALVLYTGMATLKTPYCRCPPADKAKPTTAPDIAQLTSSSSSSSAAAASSSSSLPSAAFVQPVYPSSPASACPVCCSRVLYDLSVGLPVTQRSQSCLVCGLTGSVMDEHNPPLVLPNGCVYSKSALLRMAQTNGGYVTCVRTQERYALDECKQAFVL